MADYLCVSKTSYFRVWDEEEFRKVASSILGDVDIWEQVGTDGVKRFAIAGYDYMTAFSYACDSCSSSEDSRRCKTCEYNDYRNRFSGITETAEAIQLCLPEDEVAFIFEVGHEKLRYVCGWVCMITPKDIQYMDLHQWAIEKCEQLGLPVPQMDY